jgi:hypothetical protein
MPIGVQDFETIRFEYKRHRLLVRKERYYDGKPFDTTGAIDEMKTGKAIEKKKILRGRHGLWRRTLFLIVVCLNYNTKCTDYIKMIISGNLTRPLFI